MRVTRELYALAPRAALSSPSLSPPPRVNYYFTEQSRVETCRADPREADVSILRDTHVQAVDGFIMDYSTEKSIHFVHREDR